MHPPREMDSLPEGSQGQLRNQRTTAFPQFVVFDVYNGDSEFHCEFYALAGLKVSRGTHASYEQGQKDSIETCYPLPKLEGTPKLP